MEGEEPDEGGRDVSAMYRSYCCENHVAPGVRLIEPETSFCDITARALTLRSAGGGSPSARQVIHIGTLGHRQKHGVAAYHQIEEGQTSAMPF